MTTDEQTRDPGGGPPSQAADGEGGVRPLWLVLFGLPGLGLLTLWGTAAIKGIGYLPTETTVLQFAFAIPAVGLVRLPFVLATPSPRLRVADLVLAAWGLLANVWGLVATEGHPVGILALGFAALYGLAIALIAAHAVPAATTPPDSDPGR